MNCRIDFLDMFCNSFHVEHMIFPTELRCYIPYYSVKIDLLHFLQVNENPSNGQEE